MAYSFLIKKIFYVSLIYIWMDGLTYILLIKKELINTNWWYEILILKG